MIFEQLRRCQKRCCVDIMTASMGIFRQRGKTQAAFLLHGQGIHICPQQNRRAALTDLRHDTRRADLFGRITHCRQTAHHIIFGHRKICADLGMLMDIAAVSDSCCFQSPRFF